MSNKRKEKEKLTIKFIGKRLLKSNWLLTLYSFFSVLIGTVLLVEMFNLSLSATRTYENDMKALYGDCDMGLYYSDYASIDENLVNRLGQISDVAEMATLYYSWRVQVGGASVYSIGTDNSSMVRSRYHFDSELEDGQVAVNKVLADVYGYVCGDSLEIGGQTLEIVEIFEDGTMSEGAIEMLAVNKKTLKDLDEKAGNTNIVMLKAMDGKEKQVEREIAKLGTGLEVLAFGTDEEYLKVIESFKVYIAVLTVLVIATTGLFTSTVFKGFVYKYKRDMAVLRMLGATQDQINDIFRYMIRRITFIGVSLGFVLAFCVNWMFVKELNEKWNLIEGEVKFLPVPSLLICAGIYFVLQLVLGGIIGRSNKILPMEALVSNELSTSGKMKKRKLGRGIVKKDLFISVKLISARLRENTLVIATMALLVAISILGASLSSIIKANGENYYKESYLAETVLSSSTEWNYEESIHFYQSLQADDKLKVSCMYSAGWPAKFEGTSVRYGLVDINAMIGQGLLEAGEYDENGIIISQSFKEQYQLEQGDYVNVASPKILEFGPNGIPTNIVLREEVEHTLQVKGIMPDSFFYGCEVYIDISQQNFINDRSLLERIYMDGEKEYIEQKLNRAKSMFPGIKWANYTDAVAANNSGIESRFRLLNLVVTVLVVIAAIGWINSLKNIFVSRTKDYDIIRMQGASGKRILKILIYQILIYMLIGLVIGFFVAFVVLELLMYAEQRTFTFQFNLEILGQMLCITAAFCLTLVPTMKKLCTKKILEELF